MGNFVPKAPFDMTDFLSKKGTPKPSRFRRYPATPVSSSTPAPEATEPSVKDSGDDTSSDT